VRKADKLQNAALGYYRRKKKKVVQKLKIGMNAKNVAQGEVTKHDVVDT
jgi:hypothetical protein